MPETRHETPHGHIVGHPEATCERCGGPNIVWHAPSELWNRAIPEDGILCPLCFVVAARAVGIDEIWWLQPADYTQDAQLGAALRAALVYLRQSADQLKIAHQSDGYVVWLEPRHRLYQENDATRALASLQQRAESAQQWADKWRDLAKADEEILAALQQRAERAEGERASDAEDAARYRWLRDTLTAAKAGGGVEVNEALQVYEKPVPGEEVQIFWYPDTPVGFRWVYGATLDEAIDAALASPARAALGSPTPETSE